VSQVCPDPHPIGAPFFLPNRFHIPKVEYVFNHPHDHSVIWIVFHFLIDYNIYICLGDFQGHGYDLLHNSLRFINLMIDPHLSTVQVLNGANVFLHQSFYFFLFHVPHDHKEEITGICKTICIYFFDLFIIYFFQILLVHHPGAGMVIGKN